MHGKTSSVAETAIWAKKTIGGKFGLKWPKIARMTQNGLKVVVVSNISVGKFSKDFFRHPVEQSTINQTNNNKSINQLTESRWSRHIMIKSGL